MLMLQMSGGLGNQMFTYALYKELKSRGKAVCIDDFTHYEEIGRNDNCLESIFPIQYEKGSRQEYNRLTDSSMDLFHRAKRKLAGRKELLYQEKDAISYEDGVFALEDAYLIGYWQSQKYFFRVKDELRKDFSFEWSLLPESAETYKTRMNNGNSISLHIRRGDYLSSQFFHIYGNICTDEYYRKAMDYFRERFDNCTFYLFTNDLEYGRAMEGNDVIFVDCSDASHAYVDMALMSCCRYHIIANSSFSWWGAWLNQSPDKIVIAPSRWLNISKAQDVYSGLCNVKIDNSGNIVEQNIGKLWRL